MGKTLASMLLASLSQALLLTELENQASKATRRIASGSSFGGAAPTSEASPGFSEGSPQASFQCDQGQCLPEWMEAECYPGVEDPFGGLMAAVVECMPGLTPGHFKALDRSRFFCPAARGNQQMEHKDGGWCESLTTETEQACHWANGIIHQLPEDPKSGAPGLYGIQNMIRYDDPIYFYPEGSKLSHSNAPTEPFYNVNQAYEDESRKLFTAACPSCGRNEDKPASVCIFLDFLVSNKVSKLISLAPNLDEEDMNRNGKVKCPDYIGNAIGMDFSGDLVKGESADGTACGGAFRMTSTLSDFKHSGGCTNNVWLRTIDYKGHRIEQLYYTGWPDAYVRGGSTAMPPAANNEAIKYMIEWKHEDHKNVAVHCSGGRGRTGTVAAAYIQSWKYPGLTLNSHCSGKCPTMDSLVTDVVNLRARRADMVEHPVQFLNIVKLVGLMPKDKGCEAEGKFQEECVLQAEAEDKD